MACEDASQEIYFIGVDVGTASVRAGLFSPKAGRFVDISVEPLTVNRHSFTSNSTKYCTETVSQSTEEIWDAVCKVVRDVISSVDVHCVKGIGFDATCSLVVLGPGHAPLHTCASSSSETVLNVVMWMDHRAKAEADFINKALNGRPCLDFVGGQISLEMELPKILWIKRHLPEVYKKATLFMDLCDFLTWRATNNTARSICSVVCKWLYQVDPKKPKETGWDSTILQSTELGELAENLFDKIGTSIVNPGTRLPHGVSTKAAEELGLLKGTPVATGLIDANAGALALAFCSRPGREIHNPFTRLAIICGTSSCFMICQEQPAFVPGVWGPYHSAIIPNAWATEGGQSAAGQFLDHIVRTHPYYIKSLGNGECSTMSICYAQLNFRATSLAEEQGYADVGELSEDLHIFPDFHGNRSPLANPNMKGMIVGLTLDSESEHSLIKLYIAALQALAYESRWIIETMEQNGINIEDIAVCGGLANNPLFVKTLTDAVGKPINLPEIRESVILGSVILAASASERYSSLSAAAAALAGSSKIVEPSRSTADLHRARYKVFRNMASFQSSLSVFPA